MLPSICQTAFQLQLILRTKVQAFLIQEEEKFGNLPESLQDAEKGQGISNSIEILEEILEVVESSESALEEVSSLLDIKLSIPQQEKTIEEKLSHGKSSIGFHAILPKDLLLALKCKSMLLGLSMNEIVCRALKLFISNFPYKQCVCQY